MSIRRDHPSIYNEFMKGTEKFYFSPITAFKHLLLDFPSALDDILSGLPAFCTLQLLEQGHFWQLGLIFRTNISRPAMIQTSVSHHFFL